MLQISRFDIKTGKSIQETVEDISEPAIKLVEHTYLEYWLETRGIKTHFSVGRFYDGVNESDRIRLEKEEKVLVFTNGKDGYFTDLATAQLMTMGSNEVASIYAAGSDSAHNSVAYGSLIASDGLASTAISSARILIVDNVARTHGDETLSDSHGQPVSENQLQQLYDKMGDGTMLVSQSVMTALATPEERDGITSEHQIRAIANRRVSQFRAASPDMPGIVKGTMSASQWTDRLGVDFIISTDAIKGDDGRLSRPGPKEVSSFWVNRKSDGRYGQQAVGPQVKYTIPEATRLEINPKAKAQAEELAQVAGDLSNLGQHYLQQKEREQTRPIDTLEEDVLQSNRSDWLYDTLKADTYGQLTGLAQVSRPLGRYVRGEWLKQATHATSVPSAMAQHHSQLKPWEIANRDLPHGAIVAYYRSPFPNVSAAAIAINNVEVLKREDPEAFSKQGVTYLPPFTAKAVAITDFDGDTNGFFVGYQSTVPNLPAQIRQVLSGIEAQRLSEQYEAGCALFENMVRQLDQGQESRIAAADYPLAVREFIEQTAPDIRPPEINKQDKAKHPWHEDESRASATWRAWSITANNPTGKIANAGMTLQALALDLKYAPQDQREALLRKISAHHTKLLAKADAGKLVIPSDEWLRERGFPAYQFRKRIEEIVIVGGQLSQYKDSYQRQKFVEVASKAISQLLSDAANGPNAVNLQTAVDTAKSAKGIDEALHSFIRALQHKPDALRENKDNPLNYTGQNVLVTNTQEPIAWGVQAVNSIYQSAQRQKVVPQ